MSRERTLACIGLNSFDIARLRLVLQEARDQLQAPWRIDRSDAADVLVIAPGSMEAEAAALRARGRGARCVVLGGVGEALDDHLPTGYGVPDLVAVLNAATPSASPLHIIDADSPEFFGFEEPSNADALHGVPEPFDLERYLRRDSHDNHIHKLVPHRLDAETTLEPMDDVARSARSGERHRERDPFATWHPGDPGMIDERSARPVAKSSVAHPLEDYLQGSLLMAPSRLQRADAAPLVLDPKHQHYLIAGDLAAARTYLDAPVGEDEWQRLTSTELAREREHATPQPYVRLRWLAALHRGDGWLPRHLDPGGSYRLREWLQFDDGFAESARISHALLQWRKLHEVAQEAGVDMKKVFDVVNAYDAIGYLESRRRDRLR